MAKKKTAPAKPKAAKPESKKSEETKHPDVVDSKGVESIISPEVTQDTGKEKESLKSPEIVSREKPVSDKESKKANKDLMSLKALYYSRGSGGSFKKVTGKVTVSDLLKREKHPSGTTLDSEFILENGKVFSVKENRVTERDLSNQLQILKKQK